MVTEIQDFSMPRPFLASRKFFIEGVFDSDEVWQEKEREIENCFIKYYFELFTSSNPSDFLEILEAVQPKVFPDMNLKLTREFMPREVHKPLKQMYPLKAPGPSGMPPLFFQHFWPIVGNLVTKTLLDFLNRGVTPPPPPNFNETHIVLVPKNSNPKRVIEYKPISHCNVIYKLASKTLANRLKKILPSIISES